VEMLSGVGRELGEAEGYRVIGEMVEGFAVGK